MLQGGIPPGTDVAQLEDNLNALGYNRGSEFPKDGHYSSAVVTALDRLLRDRGMANPTDKVDLGRIVYFPGPVRVQDVAAPLGSLLSAHSQVLTLTTTTRLVQTQVPGSLGVNVMAGQAASIDAGGANGPLKGIVSSVRSQPSTSSAGQQGTSQGSTNDQVATITLVGEYPDLPAGDVPVAVAITTQTTQGALAVPITAVVALVEGGYALDADDGRGKYRLTPITIGAYDDSDGLVQVSGPAVHVGLKVLAPR